MSRSYKHTPYCGLKKDKFFKNYANRRLRRRKLDHDLQHKSYKKDFGSWEICDYYEIETKNFEEYYKSCVQYWRDNHNRWYMADYDKPCPTRKECWEKYQKLYIRK